LKVASRRHRPPRPRGRTEDRPRGGDRIASATEDGPRGAVL